LSDKNTEVYKKHKINHINKVILVNKQGQFNSLSSLNKQNDFSIGFEKL
jgi:hypothetical protein